MEIIVLIVLALVLWSIEEKAKCQKRIKENYAAQPWTERVDAPGSAKFLSTDKDLKAAGLLGRQGIRIGNSVESNRPVRFDQDCHTAVIAPSGTAKTTAFCVPNVLSLDKFSLFVMDAKTEICPITVAHRAKLGPVWILLPHGTNRDYLKGYKIARYNPMARLFDPKEPRLNMGPVAMKIADGSIMAVSAAESESYWNGGAHGLFAGLMIGQARYGNPKERNLPAVRRMLSGDVMGHCERLMARNDPAVNDLLNQFLQGKKDRTSIHDVISTAAIKTKFLADEGVADMLSASTFKFSQLKERVSTVYLCTNFDFLDVTSSLARLITTCAISELQRPDIKRKVPVWMLCDEAYHYGHSASIEASYGGVRGSGVRLCTVWTDMSQIERRYTGMSRTILGNSGAIITMQTGDDLTADFMSKQSGHSTMVTATPSVSALGELSWGKSLGHEPLLPMAMALKLPADRMLVFIRGFGPVLTKKVVHFKSREFFWKSGKNPFAPRKRLLPTVFGR